MGKIDKILYEQTICPIADINSNLLRVYRAPNSEVTIHYRNLKIVLHINDISEWKEGFEKALKRLHEISGN